MQISATKQYLSGGSYRHFWRNTRILLVSLIFAVLFTSISHGSTAQAVQTVPYKINFQGRLTDATGNVKPDGLYNMKLRLFSAATGSSAIWTETRETTNRVQVTNGLFSIQLGDVAALSPSVFTNYPLYLEIELPTPATANCTTAACGAFTEGAMTPRSPLGSSPYAFNADTVDGIDGSNIARNDVLNVFSTGSTNTFNAKTQVNDSLSVVNGKAIGFNITQAGSNLQLQSAATGGYIMNDSTGLSIGAISTGAAGSTVNAAPTLKLVANNALVQSAVDGGATYGDNLISNPGFEFGCAGWLLCEGVTSTAAPASGASNLRLTQSTPTSAYDVLSRNIAVQENDKLFISAKLKTSAATTGLGGYYIRYMDSTGAALSFDNGDWNNPGTSYVTRTYVSTAPANAVYAAIGLTVRGTGTTAGTWDFDDVYVKQINQSAPVLYRNTSNSLYAFSIQNAAGSPLLVADTSNFEVRIGDGDANPDATPTLLVVDHKSTSGDPAGYNGAMYYNAIAKKFRCYEGDTWKDCVSTMLDPRLGYNYQSELTSGAFTAGGVIDPTISALSTGSGNTLTQQNNDGGSHPGIFSVSVSPTTSIAGYLGATTSNISLTTGDWSYLTSIKLGALSASGGIFTFRAGFMNSSTTAAEAGITSGCYIRSTNSVNAGQWQGVCRSGTTDTVCTIPLTVSTNWTTLNVVVSNNGSTATFTADDVNQCSISSGIPSTATTIGGHIHKAAGGTTVRTAAQDYIDVRGRFSR